MLRTRFILFMIKGFQSFLHSGYRSSYGKADKLFKKAESIKSTADFAIEKGEAAKRVSDKLGELL